MLLLVPLALAQDPLAPDRSQCVADVVDDAARRWGYKPAEFRALPTFAQQTVNNVVPAHRDFDADSYPDWIVQGVCLPSGACEQTLYISSWGCTRFAFRFTGTLVVTKAADDFVSAIETREATGCDGKAMIITDWVWQDGTYVEKGGVTCACPAKKAAGVRSERCPK